MPKSFVDQMISDGYAALAKSSLKLSNHLPENDPARQFPIETAKHYQQKADQK